MVEAGQIYRDTYYDGLNDGSREHRTIRILAIESGKVLAETITDVFGNRMDKPRKTRVSFKTLRTGYVQVPAA